MSRWVGNDIDRILGLSVCRLKLMRIYIFWLVQLMQTLPHRIRNHFRFYLDILSDLLLTNIVLLWIGQTHFVFIVLVLFVVLLLLLFFLLLLLLVFPVAVDGNYNNDSRG